MVFNSYQGKKRSLSNISWKDLKTRNVHICISMYSLLVQISILTHVNYSISIFSEDVFRFCPNILTAIRELRAVYATFGEYPSASAGYTYSLASTKESWSASRSDDIGRSIVYLTDETSERARLTDNVNLDTDLCPERIRRADRVETSLAIDYSQKWNLFARLTIKCPTTDYVLLFHSRIYLLDD